MSQKTCFDAILFNLSGQGHFDMGAYIAYFDGRLIDQDYDERELATAPAGLPNAAAKDSGKNK